MKRSFQMARVIAKYIYKCKFYYCRTTIRSHGIYVQRTIRSLGPPEFTFSTPYDHCDSTEFMFSAPYDHCGPTEFTFRTPNDHCGSTAGLAFLQRCVLSFGTAGAVADLLCVVGLAVVGPPCSSPAPPYSCYLPGSWGYQLPLHLQM